MYLYVLGPGNVLVAVVQSFFEVSMTREKCMIIRERCAFIGKTCECLTLANGQICLGSPVFLLSC